MSRREWDVVIVGAGPAGCAAAASALQQNSAARVLLLDRQQFPRDKACGDGIAAEALDVLHRLGFDLSAVLAGYPPITRLRLQSPGGAVAERKMRRAVRVIPRSVFDGRLVEQAVARGATYRQHPVRALWRTAGGVHVDDGMWAGVVIGADGAESRVRRLIGTGQPRAGQVALAIRGYAAELPGQHGTQLITMTKRNWPAYAWSFPLGDGRANVGYGELLVDRPMNRTAMLDRMRELLPGLDAHPAQLQAHRLPLSTGRPRVANGRVLLAGDALSLINPMSGEGIFYALRSGELAGLAAAHGEQAGATYRRLLRRALGSHFRSTDAAARLTRAPRLLDSGVRAAAGGQRAFDDLVLLGLGDGKLTLPLLSGIVGHLTG